MMMERGKEKRRGKKSRKNSSDSIKEIRGMDLCTSIQ